MVWVWGLGQFKANPPGALSSDTAKVLGDDLRVTQVSDFASLFEGLGSGMKPAGPPKPPKLVSLKAEEPEYAEICKDKYLDC